MADKEVKQQVFETLKDWDIYPKGSTIELLDQTVIDKAIELGVIKAKK